MHPSYYPLFTPTGRSLPAHVCDAIPGLFHFVYRMVKRGSPPAYILVDAEAFYRGGGSITPSYHSHRSIVTIVHSIAAPIRSAEGEAIESSLFLALACESSKDHATNRQVPVYTRTICNSEVQTAFLGPHDLWECMAFNIVAASYFPCRFARREVGGVHV